MCWSFGASAVFALLGFGFAIHFARKKESKLIWIPLGYFAIMETLQALSYLYLGTCTSSGNQLLTFLSYMHVVFQPFFVNAFMLYFIPPKARKKIIKPVFVIAGIIAIILILKIYPFEWAGTCAEGTALCGKVLCSYKGAIHLAWTMPMNNIGWFTFMTYYMIAAFLVPLIYGSWKTSLSGILTGPVFAIILTANPNEWPAVWCLFSVVIIMIGIFPLRKWLHVKKWYFWNYPWR